MTQGKPIHIRNPIKRPVAMRKIRTPGNKKKSFTTVWVREVDKRTFPRRNPHGGSPSRTELFLGSGKSVGRHPCTLMTLAPPRTAWGGSSTPQKTWFSDKVPRRNGTGKRTSSGSSSSGSSTATDSWGSTSGTFSSCGASACRVPTRDEKKVEMLMVVCSTVEPLY